jgi:hypothetical protein
VRGRVFWAFLRQKAGFWGEIGLKTGKNRPLMFTHWIMVYIFNLLIYNALKKFGTKNALKNT